MGRIDVYLRSIERFGAAGAVLVSGQSIKLRFPTGDRHATQVTPHDQLVMLVREVAPPAALDEIDKNRPAKFELESAGHRYAIAVAPRPGSWQVSIEAITIVSQPTERTTVAAVTRGTPAPVTKLAAVERLRGPDPSATTHRLDPNSLDRARTPDAEPSLAIERGQYDIAPVRTASGSALLDQLTSSARAAKATDLYLAAGVPACIRVDGRLSPTPIAIDGEQLSRELGIVAPPTARSAWTERGSAVFAYDDGNGRVRVTLCRDQRGPGAALRLLLGEPPALERLGLGAAVDDWLDDRGLIVIAGPSGAGKTTTLGALVRALGAKRKRVVVFEDPIELVHAGDTISQRAIGEHVASIGAGVAAAMAEGADAIAIGAVASVEAATAVVDAVAGGHLVLTTLVAPVASAAVERMLDRLPAEQRELARALVADSLLGTIGPSRTAAGQVTFEVAGRSRAS